MFAAMIRELMEIVMAAAMYAPISSGNANRNFSIILRASFLKKLKNFSKIAMWWWCWSICNKLSISIEISRLDDPFVEWERTSSRKTDPVACFKGTSQFMSRRKFSFNVEWHEQGGEGDIEMYIKWMFNMKQIAWKITLMLSERF